MNHETRVKRLFNQVKRKHNIKDEFRLKISKKEPKDRRHSFMQIDFYKTKVPLITVFVNKPYTRFEKISDRAIKNTLAHELVHHIVNKNLSQRNSKILRDALRLIDRLIDE